MVQNEVILAKIQVQYKSGQGELYYGLEVFYQKVQLWPFLRMRNGKLGKKKPKRKHGAFAASSHSKENSHVQLSITHVTLTPAPRCKINKQKKHGWGLWGGAPIRPPPLATPLATASWTRSVHHHALFSKAMWANALIAWHSLFKLISEDNRPAEQVGLRF